MRILVLGALLAAASSTGCTVAPTDAVITARWSFTHFADHTTRSCPSGFATATVFSQPWDPVTNALVGAPIKDKFDCSAMRGTTDPLDGIFLVWVQIESDDGSRVYAQSEHSYIDTADGDATIDLDLLDDAGFFFLTWDLVDAGNQAPLSCRDAGVTSTGAIETIATIAGSTFMLTDQFPCEHGFGTTDPLIAGNYTVSVEAVQNDKSVGTAPALINKKITAPNGLTDLGHILIPID